MFDFSFTNDDLSETIDFQGISADEIIMSDDDSSAEEPYFVWLFLNKDNPEELEQEIVDVIASPDFYEDILLFSSNNAYQVIFEVEDFNTLKYINKILIYFKHNLLSTTAETGDSFNNSFLSLLIAEESPHVVYYLQSLAKVSQQALYDQLNHLDSNGRHALLLAACIPNQQQTEIVEFICSYYANNFSKENCLTYFSQRDNNGLTTLHYLVLLSCFDSLECIFKLFQASILDILAIKDVKGVSVKKYAHEVASVKRTNYKQYLNGIIGILSGLKIAPNRSTNAKESLLASDFGVFVNADQTGGYIEQADLCPYCRTPNVEPERQAVVAHPTYGMNISVKIMQHTLYLIDPTNQNPVLSKRDGSSLNTEEVEKLKNEVKQLSHLTLLEKIETDIDFILDFLQRITLQAKQVRENARLRFFHEVTNDIFPAPPVNGSYSAMLHLS